MIKKLENKPEETETTIITEPVITIGYCAFCGQAVVLDKPCKTVSVAEKLSKMLCTCTKARIFQKKEAEKLKMKDNIRLNFKGRDKVIELLDVVTEAILDGAIDNISIKIDSQTKVGLKTNSDGAMELTKTVTVKEKIINNI